MTKTNGHHMNGHGRSKAGRSGPPVIGLTGGIGAGKSTVAEMLEGLGCFVVNSDALAHAALRDAEVIATLVSWWGDSILDASGGLDRRAIASIVFAEASERRRLERLVHPWIEARRRELFASAPADTRALVIDAPLLLEAGLDRECEAVIFVDANASVRLERVGASRGWSVEDLHRREQSQMPLDEKRARADHTIVNEGDRSSLKKRVQETLDDILAAMDA
ncbi:MAG: dephospho-CoA kinase [Phycisphaerales bacterium]|nr:dephospho-CoA kinase [Phycisphaerales bacterium]